MMDWREKTNNKVRVSEWEVKWNNKSKILLRWTIANVGRGHLDELEDGEGGGAVVPEHEANDAEELRVEAAVAKTKQEAA